MKKKFPWFFLTLMVLLAGMTAVIVPVVTTLNLSGTAARDNFQRFMISPMETIALQEAKKLDPGYDWIQIVDEDPSEAVRESVRSSVNTNLQQVYNYFSSDSNLCWVITYGGRNYRHNWKEEYYDSSASTLDTVISTRNNDQVLIESSDGQSYAGTNFVNSQYIPVPDTLVPVQRLEEQGNEYEYQLSLPSDFTIRFYIPARIEANGGRIANMIYSAGQARSTVLCLAGSTVVIGLFVLLCNKNAEKNTPVFRQLIGMKAFFAWILLGLLLSFGIYGTFGITEVTATGNMRNILYQEGFSSLQLRWIMPVITYGMWFVILNVISLCLLYAKYIFAFGIWRYLKEDTLTAALFGRSMRRVNDASRLEFGNWSWRKVWPVIVEGALFAIVTLTLAFQFMGVFGLVVVLLFELAGVLLLARRILFLLQRDYAITLQTARQMAMDQLEIPPRQVGSFQPIYDALMNISDGVQLALKDAIASQNMKTQLISNVSHDLKTPVTGIKSYAELISLSSSLDEIHEYSRRLDSYTERLTRLIQDLFDVARASSGDIQLQPVLINLTELVEQVLADWVEPLEEKNLSLVTHLIPDAPVEVDAEKIVRVIENLLGNLRKYALQGTRVFVTLQEIPGQYLLIFKNVSSAPLDFNPDEITERFVRGDKSRHQTGSGLGLAIVKSFMEVHGGSCTIEVDGDVFKCILGFPKAQRPQSPSQEESVQLLDQQIQAAEQQDPDGQTALKAEEISPAVQEEEADLAGLENIMIGMSNPEVQNPDVQTAPSAVQSEPLPHPEIPEEARESSQTSQAAAAAVQKQPAEK